MLPEVPISVNSDAYTVCGNALISDEAKDFSCYNYTNRRGPEQVWSFADTRMVLYGLSDFIKTHLSKKVSYLDLAEEFMGGTSLIYDAEMWRKLDGQYLPIKISSIREGEVFYPNEPIIEVSACNGFGEVAALVEPLLVGTVSRATCRATLCRHLLELIRKIIKKYHPKYTEQQVNEQASWFVHDFGFRACSGAEEANLVGRAHLLSFNGTDTFGAAYQARKMGLKPPAGDSIMALAHRTVQSYKTEGECFVNLFNKAGIGSYVADCYDFNNALEGLITLAKKSSYENLGKIIVVRPDSGDFIENTIRIVKKALEHGLYKLDEEGRPTSTTLRFIHGDSMNYDKIMQVFGTLKSMGVDPTGWGVFGVGGWLVNQCTRDTLSSAYKLCMSGEEKVVKLSEIEAKMSVPGLTSIYRYRNPSVGFKKLTDDDTKVTFYNSGILEPSLETFDVIRDRVQEFKQHFYSKYGYLECLSNEIRDFQREKLREHKE